MAFEMRKLIKDRKIKSKLLRELSKTDVQPVYIKLSEGIDPDSYAKRLMREGTIREYEIRGNGIQTYVRKIEIPLLALRNEIKWISRVEEVKLLEND
jgi:hypothetical protein